MRLALSATSLALLTACGGLSISGTVTDVTGAPLEGATISVHAPGTMCQASADAAGAFELGCKDGQAYKVAIARAGYVTKEVDVDGTAGSVFDLGAQALIRIPEKDGLFVLTEGNYVAPERGLLARHTKGPKGSSTHMDYCLDVAASKANVFPAGTIPMYAKRNTEWRVWKLDADGCAYRKERLDTRWEQTFGDKVKPKREEVLTEQEVVLLTIEDGDYFISDWHAGFFAEKKGDYGDDMRRYGGWWVTTDPSRMAATLEAK